ncbi:nucleoside phosphorylase domain-containing protein [Fusarium acuminatum]|uniref:Nucleoside phosphorylase domain-containing protein n=1 Tax=Fusarium acuminatum TaxID=5515 RepID=A0ABZ2X966_9HYPO
MSSNTATLNRPMSRADFNVAIICALTLEADPIEALFDERWDCSIYNKAPGDSNAYSTGRIGYHNVVLVYMPEAGKVNGSVAAVNCRISFPNVKLAIVVGVCGVVPFVSNRGNEHQEIILGDVIVSQNVVQYDLGSQFPDHFEYKNNLETVLGRPNNEIRTLLSKLKSLRARSALESSMAAYLTIMQRERELGAEYPGSEHDRLFEASYNHNDREKSCSECGCNGPLVRRVRLSQDSPQPKVHFGRIASGDKVLKSGKHRDAISQGLGAIAFEMESAGVWDILPCLVIKGACDYADSHKAKTVQNYVAATAAACTKAVLNYWTTPSPTVPYPENKHFIGRQNILEALQRELDPGNSPNVVALYGLGGIGKTQIALKYAYWVRVRYTDLAVFWVHASTADRMSQSYAAIAKLCQIPHHEDPGTNILALVKDWLQAKYRRPWLMVIDNTDDIQTIYGDDHLNQYIPMCPHGRLLITTRNKRVAVKMTKGQHFFQVDRMTGKESRELLTTTLKSSAFEVFSLSKVADRLEHHPLALAQASAFIQENSMPVEEYLGYLANDHTLVELLDEDFEANGRDTKSFGAVAKTWRLSLGQIQQQHPLAGEVLSLLSIYSGVTFQNDILDEYMEHRHGSKGPLERAKALGVLKAFSLISIGENGRYVMHTLVRLVVQRWLIWQRQIEHFVFEVLISLLLRYDHIILEHHIPLSSSPSKTVYSCCTFTPGLGRSRWASLDQKREMYQDCTYNMAKDMLYAYNLVKAQK